MFVLILISSFGALQIRQPKRCEPWKKSAASPPCRMPSGGSLHGESLRTKLSEDDEYPPNIHILGPTTSSATSTTTTTTTATTTILAFPCLLLCSTWGNLEAINSFSVDWNRAAVYLPQCHRPRQEIRQAMKGEVIDE